MKNSSPFGMPMPERSLSLSNYRFGFNTQEKVDEISGMGNHSTAMFWEYDTRLGRRWNLDPKPEASLSDFSCFKGNPIWYYDLLGDTGRVSINNIRFDLNSKSTTGSFNVTNDKNKDQLGGFILEPQRGTNQEAQTRGSNRAILPGDYSVVPHNSKNFPNTYELKNANLLGTKDNILIHIGNNRGNTTGCQLPGCSRGKNVVNGSGTKLGEIRAYIQKVSSDDIKSGGDGTVIVNYRIREVYKPTPRSSEIEGAPTIHPKLF